MSEDKSNKVVSVLLKSGVALSALVIAGSAFAQETPPQTTDTVSTDNAVAETAAATGQAEENVVVTGTNVRGIAIAPGTNPVSFNQKEIAATGQTSTAQLLTELPQNRDFSTVVAPNEFLPVNRPALRDLPGANLGAASATLVLMDGHRIVGMGIASTSPDPDMIPPGAIQRMDIVPDGGSSIYGADAVAGVINMMTRSRFDGVEFNARAGFADDYYSVDGNVTVGTEWEAGGIFASYGFSQHDAIYGMDRDYIRQLPGTTGLTELDCAPGNVTVGDVIFGLPYADNGGFPNSPNQCDNTDFNVITPFQRRHNALVGISQDFGDSVKFDVKAFYFNRHQISNGAFFGGGGGPFQFNGLQITGPADSPFYDDFNPAGFPGGTHTVNGRFGPDDANATEIDSMAWGVTPTLTVDLFDSWQARALGSYGESTLTRHTRQIPPNGLANAVRAGLINPYDPLSSDPSTVETLSNYESFSEGKQRLLNAKLIADGDLINLPGGAVKLAFGAEYLKTWFAAQQAGGTIVGNDGVGAPAVTVADPVNGGVVTLIPATIDLPIAKADQTVKSAFAEIVVPVFGPDNGGPGAEQLILSASVRYDHYDLFGGTTNTKLGATWKPLNWLGFRGAWGTSFNAPSPAQSEAIAEKTAGFTPADQDLFLPPASFPQPAPGQFVLGTAGGNNNLKPQEAETWTVGVDVDVPFVDGLTLSATYWNIYFKNLITSIGGVLTRTDFYQSFGNLYIINPTQAELDAALAGAEVTSTNNPSEPFNASDVYLIRFGQTANLGNFKTDGLDFAASYRRATSFGSIDLRANATYNLSKKRQNTPLDPYQDAFDELPSGFRRDPQARFRLATTAGANIGNLRAQVTWRHASAFDRAATVQTPYTHIKPWDIFDLFFRYDVNGEGVFKDLAVSMNINNVFDREPQLNGPNSTLGRFVQFGVSKRFGGF